MRYHIIKKANTEDEMLRLNDSDLKYLHSALNANLEGACIAEDSELKKKIEGIIDKIEIEQIRRKFKAEEKATGKKSSKWDRLSTAPGSAMNALMEKIERDGHYA